MRAAAETARPPRTVTIWTAFGRDEPLWMRTGRTHDRDLYLVGVQLGFRLHHLSTAGMGDINPGMNTRMLELGVARLRR